MAPRLRLVLIVSVGVLAAAGLALVPLLTRPEGPPRPPVWSGGGGETYTVERTEYTPPADSGAVAGLVDDRLEDKKTAFDPDLVDRRPLGGWLVNASEAVIRLDVPPVKPDVNPEMGVLHASYAVAMKAAGS